MHIQQIKGPRKLNPNNDLGTPVGMLNLGKARAGIKKWIGIGAV